MGQTVGEVRLRGAYGRYVKACRALGYDPDRWTLHEGSSTADGSDPVQITGATVGNVPPGVGQDGTLSAFRGAAADRLALTTLTLENVAAHLRGKGVLTEGRRNG